MNINFKNLSFALKNGKILLSDFSGFAFPNTYFSEVHVSGENKDTHMGAKMANSSEGSRLSYVSHDIENNTLSITQRSSLIEHKTVFTVYDGTDAVRIFSEIKNISDSPIVIEEASSFVLFGLGKRGIDSANDLYFTRFRQSHHAECQPECRSFLENGLFRANNESQKRLAHANIGSWSTKEELPQGIIEDRERGSVLMFEIESHDSWYYEIADKEEKYYLYLGGANLPFGNFAKKLNTGDSFCTPSVALCVGADVEDAIAKMTNYRRRIAKRQSVDLSLPPIFNEYMHLSWDSPTAENTRKIAPVAKQAGAEYYVIDCGWHNEEPGNKIYPYVGQWIESKARFPEGVRKTTDFIRSLGMKAGLWIEPEIIGIKCQDMLDYYDDDCFITRYGRKISVMGRYFLDYRCKKVREYMSETIRRMVEDYGADYIKFDYNQDMGLGTDKDSDSFGEGLASAQKAFFSWVDEMTSRFPNTVFEGCASGGMRMDYETLSHFSLVSTSDQINYMKYPYIASNLLSAVIPEQAAVWSYPVTVDSGGISVFDKDAAWVRENISDDKIAMNMINSFLGRMHLASHLDLLSEHQLSLVREGVEYYRSLTEPKCNSTPHFPLGFSKFGDEACASGFIANGTLYLAVWCLHGDTAVRIPLKDVPREAKIAYPSNSPAKFNIDGASLNVSFPSTGMAAFFEITF